MVPKAIYGVARTVVVNTHKYDIHRRYVAHVFYEFNNQGRAEELTDVDPIAVGKS